MPRLRDSLFIRLLKNRRPVLAGGGLVVLCLAAGCSPSNDSSTTQNPTPSTITVGVAEGGDNNAADVGFQQIWPLLAFEGLVNNLGPAGRPQPAIAESWNASEDGLTWRLTLRPNVFFHDGTRCDAEAVRGILEAALKRPDISLYPGLLDVREIKAEDARTLVISLKRPSAFLIDDLYIEITKLSPEGVKIGTGAYRVVSESKTEVTLEAHARYAQGAPQIKRLVFKSYPTLRQAWSSLLRGEIEAVWNLSGDALEFLTSNAIETFSFPRHYAYVMAFNSQRPNLRQPAVRRALNAAVDRNAIIQTVLKGHGKPAYTPIWPQYWAYDNNVPGYSFDPSLARTTLEAVGQNVGNRGNNPGQFSLNCIVPRDLAIFERLGLVLQTQLFNVGVDLQLEALPLSEYDARLRSGKYDAALIDLASGPSPSRAYIFWRSPGDYKGLNVFGYRNPAADRWLDGLRFASDEATIRAATSQLQRTMLDDPPGVFIAWSEQTRAVTRRINVGVAAGQDPFQALWKWRFDDSQRLVQR